MGACCLSDNLRLGTRDLKCVSCDVLGYETELLVLLACFVLSFNCPGLVFVKIDLEVVRKSDYLASGGCVGEVRDIEHLK